MLVEQTIINKNHILYKTIEDFCIRSNNFYNFALYYIKKEFTETGKWIRYQDMQKIMKDTDPYRKLMSQSSQCILQVLDRNMKSFFEANKKWKSNNENMLGRPKLPGYHKKGSKFTWFLKNNNTYIKDGKLFFRLKAMKGYGFKTHVKGRLISVRFVPKNDTFILEIIYEKETKKHDLDYSNIASIDLGSTNLITMTNNIGLRPVIIKGGVVKSVNQWFNKERSRLMGCLNEDRTWTKKLDIITRKRFQRIKNYFHHSSKFVVDYCIKNKIGTLIIGYNKEWKQEINIGKRNNQMFTHVPHNMLLQQIRYKCKLNGITIIETEESFTSGTSYFDGELPCRENYDKSRRIKRGLFKTNDGILINADVNGSLQIMRKEIPNVGNVHGIGGCLNPVVVNPLRML